MTYSVNETTLEHANVTVTDLHKTAQWMDAVFGWKLRWEGPSIYEGRSAHVGGAHSYLAIYQPPKEATDPQNSYTTRASLNHLAVVVPDIDATEARVKAAGFEPRSHADYEPGRRFYFEDHDGIEFEVVQYD